MILRPFKFRGGDDLRDDVSLITAVVGRAHNRTFIDGIAQFAFTRNSSPWCGQVGALRCPIAGCRRNFRCPQAMYAHCCSVAMGEAADPWRPRRSGRANAHAGIAQLYEYVCEMGVERLVFVVKHYEAQFEALAKHGDEELTAAIHLFSADEAAHRDEAAADESKRSPLLRAWCWIVGFGSEQAVKIARKL